MEHRPLSELVRTNALATYLGLVAAVEGSVVTRPLGFTLVRGPGFFSFCNFAAGFDVADEDLPAAVDLLRAQAQDHFGFYVFHMTGDRPAGLEPALIDGGFEPRQTLAAMASMNPGGVGVEGARLVASHDDRASVAGFMAKQFFWSMPPEARRAIAAATAASSHTVWCVGEPGDPKAAVMLVEQPDSVGLFNLCVKPELRRNGIGAALVRSVQNAAFTQSKPVVLQCSEDLVAWYEDLGFERVGVVHALTLAPDGAGDILV